MLASAEGNDSGAGDASPVDNSPADDSPAAESKAASTINLQSALTKAINATSGDDGWATLGVVGQHLGRAHADFDPRDFGHQKLSSLVDEQPYLDTRTVGSRSQVRLRSRRADKGSAKKSVTK